MDIVYIASIILHDSKLIEKSPVSQKHVKLNYSLKIMVFTSTVYLSLVITRFALTSHFVRLRVRDILLKAGVGDRCASTATIYYVSLNQAISYSDNQNIRGGVKMKAYQY